jgi:dihydroorotase
MHSALYGGVTSIFEMPNTIPATTTIEAFIHKINRAASHPWVNYAFYAGASKENYESLFALENLRGCPGVKVFMGSSTGTLLVEDDPTLELVLKHTRRPVTVHSEDEFILRARKSIAIESKNVCDHPVWRNEESALSSTKRLLNLARKFQRKVHVLHISSKQEMEFLKTQKDIASVEMLPQFLTFSAPECYYRLGTKAQQNPPIRDSSHLEFLWKAVLDGTVDILGSDHAPHLLEEKAKEYPQSPSGMPGVQTLVPLMLNFVNQKKLSLERFSELVGEGPRRVFGCFSKGRIAEGMDADLTIVDMKQEKTIEASWLKSKCGWSPYEGMKVKGWVHSVFVNGALALSEGVETGEKNGHVIEFASPK